MTLSTLQNRFSFAGNGITQIFPFNVKFIKDTDLKVIEVDDVTKVETPKTITTHYTVSGGNNATGSITMLVAPLANKTLIIYRDTSVDQDLDLIENDRLPVEEVEKRLDKAAQLAQRLKEKILRAIGLREGFTGTFDTRLPIGIDDPANAEKVIIINATSDGLDLGPTATEIADAEAFAIAAAASAVAAAASEAVAVAAAVQATESAADAAAFLSDFNEVDTSGGDVNVTLPLASDGIRIISYINKVGSGFNINVGLTGGDNLHGGAGDTLSTGDVGQYWSNGINIWYRVN